MTPNDIADLPFFCWIVESGPWHIVACSDALRTVCGATETSLTGKPLETLVGGEGAAQVMDWYAGKTRGDFPLQIKTPLFGQNGVELSVEMHAARMQEPPNTRVFCIAFVPAPGAGPARIDAAVSDQAKLDALSMIAQGMGHEINNPLQIILGMTEYLASIAGDEALLSPLRDIHAAAERIRAAVANLQNFARKENN